jgi:hypothetical protein
LAALELLVTEFGITIANGEVWGSVGLALLLGAALWLFGTWVARTVGLLRSDAPAEETLGVGLTCGLIVVAAWWAAIWSGGRSSFTPVAVGFAIGIGLVLALRLRRPPRILPLAGVARGKTGDRTAALRSREKAFVLPALAAAAFVVVVAMLYGSTMVPSPRDGVQPVEFVDEAFYAVLGRDLAASGLETNVSPSGFSDLPGFPIQAWYHWGEIWLASAAITIFGAAPLAARYFIVLPIVLLAAAAISGTLVRRIAGAGSRWAYVFGFLACLFLAPLPVIPGNFFSSWAVGMVFGITLYGLGAVTALLALYSLVVLRDQENTSWAQASFVGCAIASLLPAHIAIAILAFAGAISVWGLRIAQTTITTRRLPIVSPGFLRVLVAASLYVTAILLWGTFTGHGTGAIPAGVTPPPTPSNVSPALASPFSASWRESVAITLLGAGAFFAIPVAWLARRSGSLQADLYLGTMALLGAGAIGWGARFGDFTMFYLFFGGIAVFATPVAACGVRALWERLHARNRKTLAAALIVLCIVQLELGVAAGIVRLQLFGPNRYDPTSLGTLQAIRGLPGDSKLAYACEPLEEVGFVTPSLLSIDAHTARRVVPMCFEAETLSALLGAQKSEHIENLFFGPAPQRVLYPNASAKPSSAEVAAFLKDHGIDYIYADARHPNSLVDNAELVEANGDEQILRVP